MALGIRLVLIVVVALAGVEYMLVRSNEQFDNAKARLVLSNSNARLQTWIDDLDDGIEHPRRPDFVPDIQANSRKAERRLAERLLAENEERARLFEEEEVDIELPMRLLERAKAWLFGAATAGSVLTAFGFMSWMGHEKVEARHRQLQMDKLQLEIEALRKQQRSRTGRSVQRQ